MNKFCAQCGAQLAEDEIFCGYCGAKADEQAVPANTQAQKQSPSLQPEQKTVMTPPGQQQYQQTSERPSGPQSEIYGQVPPLPAKKKKTRLLLGICGSVAAAAVIIIVLLATDVLYNPFSMVDKWYSAYNANDTIYVISFSRKGTSSIVETDGTVIYTTYIFTSDGTGVIQATDGFEARTFTFENGILEIEGVRYFRSITAPGYCSS